MTGKSRPIRINSSAAVCAIAAALLISPTAVSQSRKAAPIKFLGQGGYTSTPSYAQSSSSTGRQSAPIRYSGATLSTSYTNTPAYSQPVRSEPESAKTKRIEFRYPDQPHIVHGSDGSVKADTSRPPMKYSSHQSAIAAHEARQYAAVGNPTPIAPKNSNPPILHQPKYTRPAIEEVSMSDVVLPPAPEPSFIVKPAAQPGFEERGLASWYGEEFHGRPTANGETFDMTALTAAHPTLPLPSLVQVKNVENNREIVVRVNDRGPFVPNRMIDLSKKAADELGFLIEGEADVVVRYLGPAPVAAQVAVGQGATPQEQSNPNRAQPSTKDYAQTYPQPRMEPIPNPVGPTYFIQAGSFSQMENAQRLSEDLGGALPVDVVLANVRGADYFRVLIGPYETRADAAAMRDQLAASSIVDGVIVRPN